MKLLLATNNKNKQKEIQQIIDEIIPNRIQIVLPLDELGYYYNVKEDGNTLEENSYIKASAFFSKSKVPSIADDTGLEIDCLKGQPGIYSARFAGDDCNDALNRQKVLELMRDAKCRTRNARFRTVICYIDSQQHCFIEGVCNGSIAQYERGNNGFGYDSIFIPTGFDKTFAEMTSGEKNKISHRRNAIGNLCKFLLDKII